MTLNILDWTEAYLKYRDSVQRKITKITKNKETSEIICELKDGTTHKYACVESLDELKKEQINTHRISCLNTKKNLDWTLNNWETLKNTKTTMFFANPKKATHWSLNPATHNNITDKIALKPGLKALFESIPEV